MNERKCDDCYANKIMLKYTFAKSEIKGLRVFALASLLVNLVMLICYARAVL